MNLKQWRKDNRYTLPAFVELLEDKGEVRVTPRTVHNWEIGFCEPSIKKLEAIRKVTNDQVSPERSSDSPSQSCREGRLRQSSS
jgi:hypothetical protein